MISHRPSGEASDQEFGSLAESVSGRITNDRTGIILTKQQPNRAKRLECAELAPAVESDEASKAGASSTHSRGFATKHVLKILAACEESGLWQQIFGCKRMLNSPRQPVR